MILLEPALSMRVPQRLRAFLRHVPALTVAALAGALAVGYPGRAAADIFSYTDEEGVIHFANKAVGDGRFRLYLKSSPRGGARATQYGGQYGGVVPFSPSDHSADRFTRYDEWIHQAAILYQIPEELIRAIIMCESNYDPRAVSPTGAQGLMQLMPETGLRMSVRDAFDPRENIFGGTRYLRVLANMFNGDLSLTIAGYNAGEAAVVRWAGIPPYDETQAYVTHVLGYYRRYRTLGDPVLASQSY
jgi:soluble lytic murein transglycosylase-like protein